LDLLKKSHGKTLKSFFGFIMKYKSVALVFILLLGFLLRFHNYAVWPRNGATFDEYAWTFLGLSLIRGDAPISWSPHKQYENKILYKNPQGAVFFLASPYLEHPPLFGLLAGGFAHMTGIRTFDDVTPESVRPLALIMGVVSIFAVYLLGASVFGIPTGLFAALLYAISPSVVAGSRLVQNENFFIPLFLLSLYVTLRVIRSPGSRYVYVLFPVLFLLPLAKVPWIAAAVSVSVIFFYNRMAKKGLAALAAGLAGIIVYILWGLYWDHRLFVSLMGLQLARYDLGYLSAFSLITDPIVTDRLFTDGLIFAGWTAFMVMASAHIKITYPVVLGLLGYLAVFLFAIPNEPGHGWYRYPFYPFLMIALAYTVIQVWRKNYVFTMVLLLITGLPALSHTVGSSIGFSYPVYRGFLLLVAVGALPAVFRNHSLSSASDKANCLTGVLVLMLTVFAALGYNEQ
jgi:4-amino-4-deoxy-L-arabinose transferase-like glycosyltransferase